MMGSKIIGFRTSWRESLADGGLWGGPPLACLGPRRRVIR